MNPSNGRDTPTQSLPVSHGSAKSVGKCGEKIAVGKRIKARAHLLLGSDIANRHYNERATGAWVFGDIIRAAGEGVWTV
jgi:hypothetical protein